jgi:hypothetical protein
VVKRRKLNLKANFEGGSSYFSCKSLIPSAFNVGLTWATCTASPWRQWRTWARGREAR